MFVNLLDIFTTLLFSKSGQREPTMTTPEAVSENSVDFTKFSDIIELSENSTKGARYDKTHSLGWKTLPRRP